MSEEGIMNVLCFIFGFIIAVLFAVTIIYITLNAYEDEVEELSIELSVYNDNFTAPDPIFTNVVDVAILIGEGEDIVYSDRNYFVNDNIQGISMYPVVFENSTLVCLEDFTKEELQINRMIVYRDLDGQSTNGYILHRIVGIQNDTYVLKGDNNIFYDEFVEYQQIECLVGMIIY